MGFRPNLSAANLRSRSTHVIGIVIPEIETSFYPKVIETAQARRKTLGYRVVFAQSNENARDELDNLNMMIDNHVDGILLSVCDGAKNKTFYESLIARGLPLVLFDRHVDDIGVPQVLSDDYNSSFFLAEELIRRGCTRIVHMRGPAGISNSLDRLNGYRDALAKWHIPYRAAVKWFIRRLRLWSRTLKVLLIRPLISWSGFFLERMCPVRLSISLPSV